MSDKEWIRVTDELPKPKQEVIAFIDVGGRATIEIAQHMGEAIWQVTGWGDPFQDCVTYWMPLPKPSTPCRTETRLETSNGDMSEMAIPEVRRYDATLERSSVGGWVRYGDYAALEHRNEALAKALMGFRINAHWIPEIGERLAKAADALLAAQKEQADAGK